ncbi:uncharacterized protein PG986_011609 [Apiospora aurea]|uniref:F-box domain-containing protein n=1 Tax=Apiospora aurea TaxID=335848 RepID=A0ABR1PXN9_9PEZI
MSGGPFAAARPPSHHHTRARSASAVVYTPRYDNNLLKPSNALAPRRSPNTNKMVAATADPGPAFVPVTAAGCGGTKGGRPNMDRQSSFGAYNAASSPSSYFPQQPRSSTRPTPPPIAPGSYAQFDNRPSPPLTWQRPSSSSSSASASTVMTRESLMRSPASSRTSFESWDSSMSPRKGDFSPSWQRPAPIKQYRRRAPGELFAALPGEVMQLILDHLSDLHLEPSSTSCATCMMRDFCSVALSARKLLFHARTALYGNIVLVGNDSAVQKKRYKLNAGTRLVLLRRTLRANPSVSAMVHTLKVPTAPAGVAVEEYQNLVASVIMACPNFEQLVGPIVTYDHTWNRLHHALSTRWKLREMNWVVGPSPYQRQRRIRSSSTAARMMAQSRNPQPLHAPPGDLQPQQSLAFLDFNTNWGRLQTLSIHCLPGATLTPLSLVESILAHMPNIEHLYLSNLPLTSFDDSSLLALPSLKTLWLSNLPGISSAGLSKFATRQSAQGLKALTLKDLHIDSLPALVRVFSNLVSLEKFAFVQNRAPVLPADEMIWLFPYLASKSLRTLHWDIPAVGGGANANPADPILAKSIAAGGFPALRSLRAPSDRDGMFQALCMPVEKIELASDRFHGRGLTNSQQRSGPTSPTATSHQAAAAAAAAASMEKPGAPSSRNLHHARLAAQNRIEAARSRPRYFVNVIDEDGSVVEKYGMSGYMGQVESRIRYQLLPDPGATDEDGGLVDMADVLADNGESLGAVERE